TDAVLRTSPDTPSPIIEEYGELVEDLSRNGVLQTSSWELPIPGALPARPAMAGIARWEALIGLPLTSLPHRSQAFPDPLHRTLAAVTDGTRDVPEICTALASLIAAQKASGNPEIEIEGFPIPLLATQALHGREALLDDP